MILGKSPIRIAQGSPFSAHFGNVKDQIKKTGSEKSAHLTEVEWGSKAIWAMPIWEQHISKRCFPKPWILGSKAHVAGRLFNVVNRF